jgi:hypothetical protein
MREMVIAGVIFACLLVAGLGSLLIHGRLPQRLRDEETYAIVKSVAGIFVILTSLVLGLMTNAAKNTFESVDRNVHAFATDIILFDRMLQQYGPETAQARELLLAYTRRAADIEPNAAGEIADRTSEGLLNDVGTSLRELKPDTAEHLSLRNDALAEYRKLVEQRWVLVEQSEGTIPAPLIIMLVTWLVLIFASFGYRAPNNALVVWSLVVAAALMAGTIYLTLDMDIPFSGPIQISPAPLVRAIAELQSQ